MTTIAMMMDEIVSNAVTMDEIVSNAVTMVVIVSNAVTMVKSIAENVTGTEVGNADAVTEMIVENADAGTLL